MSGTPFIIVAIDGGAASGKSSTARALSEKFNLLHSDTGSYYRALTAEMLRHGATPENLDSVKSALADIRLGTKVEGQSARIEISGRLPGDEIRSQEVNAAVSHFAAIPELRSALLAYQRRQADSARNGGFAGLVMEGRDIGSVIFPDADFRFFLHADPAERERRRVNQGQVDKVAERDRLDSSRKTAPLSQTAGAIPIDTTHLTLNEVAAKMAHVISGRHAAA
ncbi:MAG TPA: (d)CMP kinase [Opitutaceae bacterium]|jgi:cytidylate kinase|nr:(d)CMP kinase [Opitutaceae bacterium]